MNTYKKLKLRARRQRGIIITLTLFLICITALSVYFNSNSFIQAITLKQYKDSIKCEAFQASFDTSTHVINNVNNTLTLNTDETLEPIFVTLYIQNLTAPNLTLNGTEVKNNLVKVDLINCSNTVYLEFQSTNETWEIKITEIKTFYRTLVFSTEITLIYKEIQDVYIKITAEVTAFKDDYSNRQLNFTLPANWFIWAVKENDTPINYAIDNRTDYIVLYLNAVGNYRYQIYCEINGV